MNTLVFKICYGKRIRVSYGSGRTERKFIYADHVPKAKLTNLVKRANLADSPARMSNFMSRSLGYKAGEYDDSGNAAAASAAMLVDLMKKKIAELGAAGREKYRRGLIHGNKRPEQQAAHEFIPYSFFFNSLRGLQVNVDKRMADAAAWDEPTRTHIVDEIERAEHWLHGVKQKLKA